MKKIALYSVVTYVQFSHSGSKITNLIVSVPAETDKEFLRIHNMEILLHDFPLERGYSNHYCAVIKIPDRVPYGEASYRVILEEIS